MSVPLLEECFRWFGPEDPLTLKMIRQCGCSGVFSALHQVPYGTVWPLHAIRERRALIASEGLRWSVVESVPVSEDIKTGSGNVEEHIEAYAKTVANLGSVGIDCVVYNFMPALDWVRTDLRYPLPDGSFALRYDPIDFCVFDLFILKRDGAEADWTSEAIESALSRFHSMSQKDCRKLERTIIDIFPGQKFGFDLSAIRQRVEAYQGIGPEQLRKNCRVFLEQVIPIAEAAGVRMAIHPDDPPFSVLGLPRIVSTEGDIEKIDSLVESDSNGLCYCSGSLGARRDNDLTRIVERFRKKISAVHLRSVEVEPDGSFYEANHLEGRTDMFSVASVLLEEQMRRKVAGATPWQLSFRPDHGRVILDDIGKSTDGTPGYACIGRLKGLAELRGLQMGISRSQTNRIQCYESS